MERAPYWRATTIASTLMLINYSLASLTFLKVNVTSWRAAQHRDSILASHPATQGSILGVPKNFSLVVAEIY